MEDKPEDKPEDKLEDRLEDRLEVRAEVKAEEEAEDGVEETVEEMEELLVVRQEAPRQEARSQREDKLPHRKILPSLCSRKEIRGIDYLDRVRQEPGGT